MGASNSKINETSPEDINKKFISLLKNSDLACNYLTKYIEEEKKHTELRKNLDNFENFEMSCDNFVVLTEKILKKHFKKIKLNNINQLDYKVDSDSINKIFYLSAENYDKISKEKMKNITKIISKYYIFIYFIIKNIFKNINTDPNLKFMNISDSQQTDNQDYNLTGGSVASSIQKFLSNISDKKSSSLEKKDTNSSNNNNNDNNDTELSEKNKTNSLLSVFDFKPNYVTKSQENKEPILSDNISQENKEPILSDNISQENKEPILADNISQENKESILSDKISQENKESILSDKIFDKKSNTLSNNSNLLLEKQTSSNNRFDITNHHNLSTINSLFVYIQSVNNPEKNTIDNLSEFFSKSDNLINELSNYDILTYFIYIMNDKKYKESKELFQKNNDKLFFKVDKYFKKIYNKQCTDIDIDHFDNLKIKYDVFLYKFEFISNYLIENKEKFKHIFDNKNLLENIDGILKTLKTKLEKKNKKLYAYFDKIILEQDLFDFNDSNDSALETDHNKASEFDKSLVGVQYEDSSDDEKLSNEDPKSTTYSSNKKTINVLNEQLSFNDLHEIYIDNVYITFKKITLFLYYLNDIYNKLIVEIKKEVDDIDTQCRDYYLKKNKSLDENMSDNFEEKEPEPEQEEAEQSENNEGEEHAEQEEQAENDEGEEHAEQEEQSENDEDKEQSENDEYKEQAENDEDEEHAEQEEQEEQSYNDEHEEHAEQEEQAENDEREEQSDQEEQAENDEDNVQTKQEKQSGETIDDNDKTLEDNDVTQQQEQKQSSNSILNSILNLTNNSSKKIHNSNTSNRTKKKKI